MRKLIWNDFLRAHKETGKVFRITIFQVCIFNFLKKNFDIHLWTSLFSHFSKFVGRIWGRICQSTCLDKQYQHSFVFEVEHKHKKTQNSTQIYCLTGLFQVDGGKIQVFGHKTPCCTPQLQIPGKDIGYMPQELALYFSFRINELFFFYGKLNGMRNDDLLKQIDFIADLLHLPNGDRIIGTLSGGQKRLISFGASMMHDPRLLILDEPTVGVDPVLSAKIWRHLVYLSSNRGTTIIITTHYIEEARQANRVGLMRAGKILCEGEPEALIEEKGAKNLEGVFLDLCQQDISPGKFVNLKYMVFCRGCQISDTGWTANCHC